MTMVVGMFDSLVEVQRAVGDLLDAGYARNTISILVRDTHADPWGVHQDFEPPATDEGHAISSRPRAAQFGADVEKAPKILAGGPLATVLRQSSRDDPEAAVCAH